MQNIKRIDHITFMCRPENHDAYLQKWKDLFQIKFDAESDGSLMGLRYDWSWESGLELLSPVGNELEISKIAWQFLEERGEGLFSLIMGVDDINKAREHARSLGYQTRDVEYKPEHVGMQKCDQVTIERWLGIYVAYGEVITDDPK
jgi:hypothetical protein